MFVIIVKKVYIYIIIGFLNLLTIKNVMIYMVKTNINISFLKYSIFSIYFSILSKYTIISIVCSTFIKMSQNLH